MRLARRKVAGARTIIPVDNKLATRSIGAPTALNTSRWGNGAGAKVASRSLARALCVARALAARLARVAVVSQTDGVNINGVGRARSRHHQGTKVAAIHLP
jgi:hypothetical protein